MKKEYRSPIVRKIRIDNEIALVMMSIGPPTDPPGKAIKPKHLEPTIKAPIKPKYSSDEWKSPFAD